METLQKRFAKRAITPQSSVANTRKIQIKKHTTMHTKNTISQTLNLRGFKRIVPTDEALQNLNMTLHRFNKILENKVEMTLPEAAAFAHWLNVSIESLTEPPHTN